MALIALGVAAALWWYWNRTPHLYSDTTMAIYRAFEVDRSIARRLLYPRWALDFNFSYGAPLLQYRAPLVHYVIPAFRWAGLGWIDAARATASLFLFLSGVGMYVYARWLFADRRAALVSATGYLLAPYLLANIHERGALSEAAALAVLPWLFWSAHRTLRNDGPLWPWLTAFLAAMLVLSHNIVAFLAAPFLVIVLMALAWREGSPRSFVAVLGALALGLGMSAMYWMPALFERDYSKISENMLQNISADWLTTIGEVIQWRLVFDYWGPERFRLALWQAIVAAIALALVGLRLREHNPGPSRSALMVSLGLTVAAVLLVQLDVSSGFWDHAPLVRYAQFPWRPLGIAAFCVALLAGYVTTWPRLGGAAGWGVALGLIALIAVAGLGRLGPTYYPYAAGIAEDDITLQGLSERGRSYFTIFNDFLPVGVGVSPQELLEPRPRSNPRPDPLDAVPMLVVTEDRPTGLALQVNASEPFTARFNRFYYPGWQVYADGRPTATEASGALGLVTADLPAGEYPLMLAFEQTPLRTLADVIAGAAWLAWIAAGIVIRQARRALLGAAIAAVVFMGLGMAHHGLGEAPRQPAARTINFANTLRLVGYHIPEKSWRPGEDIPVTLYWLAQRSPEVDYTIFLHLVTPDDSARVAQSDSRPNYGYGATSRWEPGEIVVDEQILRLDESAAPGRYKLLAGVYDPATLQNLRALDDADVLPGDRVVLSEIEVAGE